MKAQNLSLLQLIQLHEGQLDEAESQRVRERINHDQRWMQRWRQVQQAYQTLAGRVEQNGHGIDVRRLANVAFDSLDVAAYVEGRLEAVKARSLEAACWVSPEQLIEVVDGFRFIHFQQHDSQKQPESLTDRLFALPDWDAAPPPPPPPPPPIAQNSATPSTQPIQLEVPDPSSHRWRRSDAGDHRLYFLAIAGVLALVALTLSGILLQRLSIRTATPLPSGQTPRTDQKGDGRDNIDVESETAPLTTHDEEDPQPETPMTYPRLIFPDHDDRIATELPVNRDSELDLDETFPGPAAPPVPDVADPKQIALSIQWQTIRGLLAARNNANQTWAGAQSDATRTKADQFMTLPDSWAAGRSGELGEIVLGSSSIVHLSRVNDSSVPINAVVERGQLAFRELPKDTQLSVQASGVQWHVHVKQPETTLAVETRQGEPRLMVRRGAIEIDDVPVQRGHQIYGSFAPDLRPQPIEGSLSWVDRPQRPVRMNENLRQSLLATDDVVGELNKLVSTTSRAQRDTMIAWSTALNPEGSLIGWLNGDDAELRASTLKWVLQQPISNLDVRRVWAALAHHTGDPQSVRSIYKWATLAQARHRLPRDEARHMVQMLDSPHLVFRHAAALLLEMAFGNPFHYRADASVVERRVSARKWAAGINRRYQAITTPQQIQPRSTRQPQRNSAIDSAPAVQRSPASQTSRGRPTRSNPGAARDTSR